ncbi:hypothetical protein [Aureimonas glaciei]|uniref:Uncharacterized protein n=1 Tax=Aureimonas glaciei TaxID=1776957 RepID=A0A916YFH6_9HYPH|nr:hypothetical protein [Aureimonas glaciei]GGD42506.1 hypothetical protein GCM10011335_51510 [Aureimonas glaciei]
MRLMSRRFGNGATPLKAFKREAAVAFRELLAGIVLRCQITKTSRVIDDAIVSDRSSQNMAGKRVGAWKGGKRTLEEIVQRMLEDAIVKSGYRREEVALALVKSAAELSGVQSDPSRRAVITAMEAALVILRRADGYALMRIEDLQAPADKL